MKKVARIIGLVAVVLVIAGLTAGILYYQKNLKPTYISSQTEQAQHLEDFFADDTSLFIFVDAQNNQERARVDSLLQKISGKNLDGYMMQLADSLIKEGTLTREAATALTKSPRIAFGGSFPTFVWGKNPATEKKPKTTKTPTFTLAFETAEAAELATEVKKMNAMAVDDVLVLSSDTGETLKARTTQHFWEKKSLSRNTEFKKFALQADTNSFGQLYMKTPPALVLGSLTATDDAFGATLRSRFSPSSDATKKLVSLYNEPHESLIKNIPTNGMVALIESFGIATQLSLQPEVGALTTQMTGIDVAADIGDVTTDFVLQDVGQQIPALSLYIDESTRQNGAGGGEGTGGSGPEALAGSLAFGILKKIDAQVNNLIAYANYTVRTDPLKGPFVSRTAVVNTGISATRISLHPENIAPGTELPPFLSALSKALTLTYGTVRRGDFAMTFISTNPFIIENLTSPALLGVGTKDLQNYREETYPNGGVAYVSVSHFGDIVARFLELVAASSPAAQNPTQKPMALSLVATQLRATLKKFGTLYTVTGTDGEGLVQKMILKIVK